MTSLLLRGRLGYGRIVTITSLEVFQTLMDQSLLRPQVMCWSHISAYSRRNDSKKIDGAFKTVKSKVRIEGWSYYLLKY